MCFSDRTRLHVAHSQSCYCLPLPPPPAILPRLSTTSLFSSSPPPPHTPPLSLSSCFSIASLEAELSEVNQSHRHYHARHLELTHRHTSHLAVYLRQHGYLLQPPLDDKKNPLPHLDEKKKNIDEHHHDGDNKENDSTPPPRFRSSESQK